ncbi:MAG: hypothetical protein IJ002_04035 [Clostridia bacterium]|nr:hypothetical protein [Clostridia bacterium]
MKNYETPILNVVEFDAINVIMTSGEDTTTAITKPTGGYDTAETQSLYN